MLRELVDISVVTITRNNLSGLTRTRKSVEIQRDVNVQHIIVDGDSSDGSGLLIERWRSEGLIETPSGIDTGIYSAMNIGLAAASAPWIWFLNAGDTFVNCRSAYNGIQAIGDQNWVYGAVIPVDHTGLRMHATLQAKATRSGICWGQKYFNHQALIMRTEFLRSIGGFNEHFKYAGEFEMYIRAIDSGLPRRVKEEWVFFELGGISSSAARLHLKEVHAARKMHFARGPIPSMRNRSVTTYRIFRNWVGSQRIPWIQRLRMWYLMKRFRFHE